jgi:hypothetical protein
MMNGRHLIIAGLSLFGASANADTVCGSASVAVSIPAGAVGLQTSSDGPVATVLNAAGGTRTHSMIAHGNGYITHSTMYQPQASSSFSCSSPINASQLGNGAPGMEQINMGSLYAFTYGPSGPGAGGSGVFGGMTEFFYQRGNGDGLNRGLTAADWLWITAPYAAVGNGTYRLKFTSSGPLSTYLLYQFRDYQNINSGGIPSGSGSVCSTTLAWAQYMSGNGTINNNNTYSHAIVSNALHAVHNTVYNACNSGLGFWDGVLADTFGAIACARWSDDCVFGICAPEFPSTCTLAADQVSNCFSTNQCATSDRTIWQGVANSGSTTATSISPDNIGGWANHGWGATAPYSVWSWDNPNQVYWSSAGNVYGCW